MCCHGGAAGGPDLWCVWRRWRRTVVSVRLRPPPRPCSRSVSLRLHGSPEISTESGEGGRAAGHINTAFDFLKQRLIAIRRNRRKALPCDTGKPSAKITSNYLSYYKLLISALVSACDSVQIHLTMFHWMSPYSLTLYCAFRRQMACLWESDCLSLSLFLPCVYFIFTLFFLRPFWFL